MRGLLVLSVAVVLRTLVGDNASGQEPETLDFSRQQLMVLSMQTSPQNQLFALPQTFRFPDSARHQSTFGIDVSHHIEDACKCQIDWEDVAQSEVRFVYFKATQGSTFVDNTFLRNRDVTLTM